MGRGIRLLGWVSLGIVTAAVAAACGTSVREEPTGAAGADSGGTDNAGAGASVEPEAGRPSEVPRIRLSGGMPLHVPTRCEERDCPIGERCFRLSDEIAICSPTELPAPTECPQEMNSAGGLPVPDDACGCGDLACADGQQCRTLTGTCSCAPHRYNACVEAACLADTDCGADVCVPTAFIYDKRCYTPSCRGDRDCDGGRHCVLMLDNPQQAGEVAFLGTRCEMPEAP